MKIGFFLSLVGALAIAMVFGGCGGGDAEPLPKAAFIKQADAICLQASKDREAAMNEAAKSGDDASPEELINDVALPPTQQMVDELDDLGAPEGDEVEVDAIIADFEKGIETVEGDPKEALGSDAFETANEAALAYGLSECAI